MYQPMFERDLLYQTSILKEPGSVHISVLKPDISGKLPVMISPKTTHNPLEYKDIIVDIIQADIFDRIQIDIKTQGIFFFEMENKEFMKLTYRDGEQIAEKTSDLI